MKITRFLAFSVLTLTLVYTSICPSVFASIWESGKIVYTSQSFGDLDICFMGPDGDDRTLLTFSAADDYDPTWSPSGRHILFVSERDGQPDIYIMNDDGTNKQQIRSNSGHRTSPTWAPDGQRFAYSWNLEEIWIYDFITRSAEYLAEGANPAWSPDGRYIAFIRGGGGSNSWVGASLYVLDLETDIESRLVRGITNAGLANPTWGPQSDYIVFSWLDVNLANDYGIYYVPRWGGSENIMNWWDGYRLLHPALSPYGGETLVTRYDANNGNAHIYKITHRTNNGQRLTSDLDSTFNDDADWWHPTSFPVQPQASLSTTTWGELKRE